MNCVRRAIPPGWARWYMDPPIQWVGVPVQYGQDGNIGNSSDDEEAKNNDNQTQMVQIDFNSLQSIDKIHYCLGMLKYVSCNFMFYSFKFTIWTVKKFFLTFRDTMYMMYN